MKAITHSTKFLIGLLFCLGMLISAGAVVKRGQAAGVPANEELAVDDGPALADAHNAMRRQSSRPVRHFLRRTAGAA